jgi:CelD/BcsL family acetyltransferase involved in cellulose biosynthesis
MSEFFRLHTARARSNRGPRHPDHFASPRARAFLQALTCDLLAEERFMICRLRVGKDVVASRLIFLSGGCFYLYHSGFDPAWWRYSVSTTLTAECIKLAIARGAHTVNLSTGRDASKLRWGPEEHLIGGVAFSSRAARSRTVTATRDLTKLIEQYLRAFASRQA